MKMYDVMHHAVKRTVERLGISAEHAKNHVVNLMQTAFYNGSTPHPSGKMARIYDHHKSRTRIVVDETEQTVITVYKMPKPLVISGDSEIVALVRKTVQRELAKARRHFTQETRKLKIEQAELGVEIAKATVNKARCKAPHTQALIQERIDAMQTYSNVIGARLHELQAEYSRKKSEASELLPVMTL